MATLHKFDALVCTTEVDGVWESWISEKWLPAPVRTKLRELFPGEGSAWLIRLDRWFTPPDMKGCEQIYNQEHCLALNDATIPCIVNGNVDYSAWDD